MPASRVLLVLIVTLTGTDDLGTVVTVSVATDLAGFYELTDLRPSDAAGTRFRGAAGRFPERD